MEGIIVEIMAARVGIVLRRPIPTEDEQSKKISQGEVSTDSPNSSLVYSAHHIRHTPQLTPQVNTKPCCNHIA